MTAHHWSCPGCSRSLMEACCGDHVPLCGLCELLPPERILAYSERWKITETQRLAWMRGCDRLRRRA